jgi:hypothetical protein
MTQGEEGGGGYNTSQSGIKLMTRGRGRTAWVVYAIRRRQQTTKHGIGKGATNKVKGTMWVRWRWLGADGGGWGGQQKTRQWWGWDSNFFLRMHHVFVGSEGRRLGVSY